MVHRSFDVARFYDDPFSTIDGVGRGNLASVAEIADYARWRNGACDYLDASHWEALAQSARNHGVDGSLFNDLHLARIVLLAPIKDLPAMMDERADQGTASSRRLPFTPVTANVSKATSMRRIRAWARKDCHKARLTVVHAGAISWHVRRYTSATLIQPYSIFIAALVLWAFAWTSAELRDKICPPAGNDEQASSVTPKSRGPESMPSQSEYRIDLENEICEEFPMVVNIDRPLDDEFVQMFVRRGEGSVTLRTHNVRDLCTRAGARDILHRAARMLRQSTSTPLAARHYADALTSLARS